MSLNKSAFPAPVVRFVWRVATMEVPNLMGEGKTYESHPVGPVHIFREQTLTVDETAFCGYAFPPNTNTAHNKVRPAGLALCPACETGWKSAADSPWSRWTGTVVSLLLAFVLLACMTPTLAASTLTPTAGTDPASTESARLHQGSEYVEPTADRRPAPECVVVLADSLHVRDLPDFESGAVTGYLFFGDIVRVLDRRDGWVLTRQGWSKADWLAAEPCP